MNQLSNDYLSEYEAADFLRVDYDDIFLRLIDSGELDGTYYSFRLDWRVFSKQKLSQWMDYRIEQADR